MAELTQDEYTVLMIMAEGASLSATGRWEKPLDALVARGLAERHDKFNNVITAAGRMALDERETHDATAVLANASQVTGAHEIALANVEQAAKNLAVAARLSAPVTGDDVDTSLLTWNIECLRRARELLR
jgi:hypothetical protein